MLNDTLSRQLDSCLQREGQRMIDHKGQEYKVFFRRNSTKNVTYDYLTMFYPANNGLEVGAELRFADGDSNVVLLVLNAEHIEGSVYRKSDALRCNHIVDLCYVTTGMDAKGDTTTVATPYDSNVPICVFSSIHANLLTTKADDLRFYMAARHGVSITSSIKITELQETKTHKFEPHSAFYQPSAIDYGNMIVNGDNSTSGLVEVLASSDGRPHNT